nr:hypothetical protein [Tanacetum cinerariifolium]
MVNVTPPDHVDEVRVVEPNQHDDVPVVPEPVLIIMVNVTPPDHVDEVRVVEPNQHDDVPVVPEPVLDEDETIPASVQKVGELSAAPFLQEDSDILFPGLIRRDINSLFGRMASSSRRLCVRETAHALVEKNVEQRMDAMKKLVEKLGNTEDKVEFKKLKKELEEARGFLFEERPNEAINVPIEDEKSHVSEPQESPRDPYVDAVIAAERARQVNVRNDCNRAVFCGVERAIELRRWFEKTKSVFEISKCAKGKKVKFDAATLEGPALTWWKTKVKEYNVVAHTQRFNELDLMCPRMVEPERVKVDAYIRGLMDNIKGEVTSSNPANLNEAVRMAHKLMEQKSQARDASILEGKKQKWESLQGGNNIGKGNQRDNSHHTLQNSQKQGNARAMCMIKCHKCGKVGHKSRYYKENSVATRANAQSIWTCYDYNEQGHTRNRCPKKVKQEEDGEAHGRAYAIKDAEPQGPNVVTGTFLLNNRYAFVLFDSGSDRSFMDTRFSAMLDIDLIKIGVSYEVELADGSLGTFDVIIGMDWLVKHDAIIVCGEKVVYIPYGNEMLIVKIDKGVSRLKSKSKERRMEDVPVIRDFLEELLGLPPSRQVKFRIDLVPGLHLLHVHCIDWHRLR